MYLGTYCKHLAKVGQPRELLSAITGHSLVMLLLASSSKARSNDIRPWAYQKCSYFLARQAPGPLPKLLLAGRTQRRMPRYPDRTNGEAPTHTSPYIHTSPAEPDTTVSLRVPLPR